MRFGEKLCMLLIEFWLQCQTSHSPNILNGFSDDLFKRDDIIIGYSQDSISLWGLDHTSQIIDNKARFRLPAMWYKFLHHRAVSQQFAANEHTSTHPNLWHQNCHRIHRKYEPGLKPTFFSNPQSIPKKIFDRFSTSIDLCKTLTLH